MPLLPDLLWRLAYRRIRPLEALLLVRWARAARVGPAVAPAAPHGLVPEFRSDGVGIQSFSRLATRQLARLHGVPYLHVPFLRLAHQHVDPIGRTVSARAWAARWERFLGLGEGEASLDGLADTIGDLRAARLVYDGYAHLNEPPLPGPAVHTVDLDVMRRGGTHGVAFDAATVSDARRRFAANGYGPPEPLYNDAYLDIALHIRRGDVWAQAPSREGGGYRVRFLSEEYYVDLIGRLSDALAGSERPVRFHIFSDGSPGQFPRFRFVGDRDAELDLPSGRTVPRIAFHLRDDTFDTLYHLARAPVLVPAKSAFCALAILIGDGRVLFDESVFELGPFALLETYLRSTDRAHPLDDFAAAAAAVLPLRRAEREPPRA